MPKAKSPREAAARALCRREGHLENITFEGRPMWESFLPVVDVVLEATGLTPTSPADAAPKAGVRGGDRGR
jgi:hypothetical protein